PARALRPQTLLGAGENEMRLDAEGGADVVEDRDGDRALAAHIVVEGAPCDPDRSRHPRDAAASGRDLAVQLPANGRIELIAGCRHLCHDSTGMCSGCRHIGGYVLE